MKEMQQNINLIQEHTKSYNFDQTNKKEKKVLLDTAKKLR
jgi:hypothetical protein